MLSVILKSVDMLSFIVLSAALPNKNQNVVQFRVLHIDIKIGSSTECSAPGSSLCVSTTIYMVKIF